LKGLAADVLHGIPTRATYEDTIQVIEYRFGEQNFVAVYRCQLTRIQKAGESLKDNATTIEQLAIAPTHPARGAYKEGGGKSFSYGVGDPEV
jgi:hypothetical protein